MPRIWAWGFLINGGAGEEADLASDSLASRKARGGLLAQDA